MGFLVYRTRYCRYCEMACSLLATLGHPVEVILVDEMPEQRPIMEARSRRRSVPQIFFGELHIGGYDDLAALHRAGDLEALLAQAVSTPSGASPGESSS